MQCTPGGVTRKWPTVCPQGNGQNGNDESEQGTDTNLYVYIHVYYCRNPKCVHLSEGI